MRRAPTHNDRVLCREPAVAKICRSAEMGVNVYQTFNYVRTFTPHPVPAIEAVCCALAKNAVDIRPGVMIIFSENGKTPRLLAKYRPPCPGGALCLLHHMLALTSS